METWMMSPHELRLSNRLWSLIVLRLVVVTVLFGTLIIQHIYQQQVYVSRYLNPFYYLILGTYGYSLVCMALLRRRRSLTLLAYLQLAFDTALITGFIYASGGSHSIFSFLYFIIIFTAASMLYRRGALTIASVAALFYCWIYAMDTFQILPVVVPPEFPQADGDEFGWLSLAYKLFAFYFIAFLSGTLAEAGRRLEVERDEQAIELSGLEAFNRHVVLSMRQGLIVTDLEGIVTHANQTASDLLQITQPDLLGRPLDHAFSLCAWMTELPHQDTAVWDLEIPTTYSDRDRRATYVRMSRFPFRDERQKEIGKMLLIEDLSDLREMENRARQAEWMSAIGQMAAGIAHEIRNPLASMSGSFELLQDEPALYASPENQRLMDIIRRELKRLDSIVGDFLSFARPQTPRGGSVDIALLIDEIITLMKTNRRIGEDIRINLDVEPALVLTTDAAMMRQVLWNLINNALEAMRESGTLNLCARWSEAQDSSSRHLVLSIQDSGPGMTLEIQKRIFEPFFTTKEKGTGLGLSTVKRLLEGMNSEIAVTSSPGEGTTFHLLLRPMIVKTQTEFLPASLVKNLSTSSEL